MENKENENKYKAQINHLRSNYKRITIDDIDTNGTYMEYILKAY